MDVPRKTHVVEVAEFHVEGLSWACHASQHNLGSSCCEARDGIFVDGHPSCEAIIYDYTGRKHSDPADKLTALSSIVTAIAETRKCKYSAGIWEDKVQEELLWVRGLTTVEQPRPSTYRAPSWSWASIDGQLLIWHPFSTPICEIIECETVLLDAGAPCGAVRDGWLIVQGPLKRGVYHIEGDNDSHISWELLDSQQRRDQQWDLVLDATKEPTDGIAGVSFGES